MRPVILYGTFLLSLVSFCFITTSFAQTKEEAIANIKSEFQRINADKSLKVLELNNEEVSSEALDNGASLTAFYKDKEVFKIQVFAGLSFGIRTYEYYFKNGQVFFVFEKEQGFIYNKTGTLDNSRSQTTFEGRYYLNEDKLIDLKSKGAKRFDENNVLSTKQLLKAAKHYLAMVRDRLNRSK